ncbi:hypothetical protein [Microbacterium sp. GXF6406]
MGMKDARAQARRDREDLLTGIGVGALAVGYVLYRGIGGIAEMFSNPGAVTVRVPLPDQQITASIGDGAPAIVSSGTVIAPGVSVVAIVFLVMATVAGMLGLILAAVTGVIVCRRLLQGIVFDVVNTRLLFTLSIALLVAGLGEAFFRNMGLNGVFAALGGDFDGSPGLILEAVPLFIAAIAVGVVVIPFRRGTALQRETEGLV